MTNRREDDKTIGEVFRRLVDMDERYEKMLDSIDTQVRLTNGRTTRLETQVETLNREMRELRHGDAATPPSLPVVTPEGESLSIKISKKMFAMILSVVTALLVFVPLIADWIEGLLKNP